MDRLSKMKFSAEMTELKTNHAKSIEEIIKLKTTLHRFKTYTSLAALAIVFSFVMFLKYDNSKYTDIMMEKEFLSKIIENKDKELQSLQKEYNLVTSNSSVVYVGKEDMLADLQKNYQDVSLKTKIAILETIIQEAQKYNINPLILYSMCYTESSFKPWMEHELVSIVKDGKPMKVRAVGLMGVLWEWHGQKLKDAGIAETRGDLFDPVTNIKAGAFIYNQYYHMDMHKSANYKDESALLRYFGGDYFSYVQKIDSKIATFVRPNLYRKN